MSLHRPNVIHPLTSLPVEKSPGETWETEHEGFHGQNEWNPLVVSNLQACITQHVTGIYTLHSQQQEQRHEVDFTIPYFLGFQYRLGYSCAMVSNKCSENVWVGKQCRSQKGGGVQL